MIHAPTQTPGRLEGPLTVGGPREGAGPVPRVVGLDLSLTSTGVASNAGWTERIRTRPGADPFTRLRTIRSEVLDRVRGGLEHADLVVVEGPAFRGAGNETGHHQRAGLWWLVLEAIDARDIPWAQVPPACLKRYATGKGNASKDEVLAAVIRRFPAVEVAGNDAADALVLAAMGADHMGVPMVEMPAAHRTGLAKVAWPTLAARSET